MKDVPTFEVGDKVVDKFGNIWPVLEVRTEVIVNESFDGPPGSSSRSYFPADEVQLLVCNHTDCFGNPYKDWTLFGGPFVYCPRCGEKL